MSNTWKLEPFYKEIVNIFTRDDGSIRTTTERPYVGPLGPQLLGTILAHNPSVKGTELVKEYCEKANKITDQKRRKQWIQDAQGLSAALEAYADDKMDESEYIGKIVKFHHEWGIEHVMVNYKRNLIIAANRMFEANYNTMERLNCYVVPQAVMEAQLFDVKQEENEEEATHPDGPLPCLYKIFEDEDMTTIFMTV